MRNAIIKYTIHIIIAFQFGFLSNCTAWPALTAAIGALGNSKSSSPIFILPPESSSQPQDRPIPSDNTDLVLDPESFEIPVAPNPGSPELIVVSRTGNLVSESGSTATATLRLSQRPDQNVRVHNFNLSLAGEVAVSPHEIVFTPENWDSGQILTFTGLPDSTQDGDREVVIQLGVMESLDNRFQGVDAGDIRVLNTDIDSVGVAIYPLTGLQTSEDGDTDQVTVVLNSMPTADVSFSVQASPATEVTASTSSITFTPGNWNNPQVITLTGVNDNIKDGNQLFTVQLVSGTSADPLYDGMTSSIAHGTNLDNDTASVVVNTTAPLPYTTSEDGTSITFNVRLSSQPTHTVTIPVFSLSPTEGLPSTANLIFTTANWNVEQNLVVTGQNDNDIDGDRSYTIRLDKPVSDDPEYSSLHHIDISLTNLDNDSAGLVFSHHLNLTTGEDGTNDNFRIRLRSRPTANVTVHLESSDTSEGTISPTTVTFTPVNWDTNRTINIYGVNDSLIDGDIWYEIRFTSIVSADTHYNGLVVDPLPVVNLDDDTPGVMYLGASNLITNENQSGSTTFQVRLKTRPTHNVHFPLIQSNNTNEGTVAPTELLFTPSNWNVPQTISIQPVRDWTVDPDVIYQITFANLESDDPLYSNFVVDAVPVTNRNSDTFGYIFNPAFGSINLVVTDTGLSDNFTLRLNSKPTANVTIPLSTLDPVRMSVSPAVIEFTPDNWDTPQSVEVNGIFVVEATPVNTAIGLRLGVWDSSESKYYPTGTSDYASFAFGDRNGTGSDNGILNVRRFNTQRPITVIHPLIASASSRLTTTEAGVEVPLRFRLGWEPTDPVTIELTSTRPDEGLPIPSSITIDPADWEEVHTVLIQGQNDDIVDGHQNYEIHFSVSSADPDFDEYNLIRVLFRNNDNNNNRLIRSPGNSATSPYVTTRKPGPRNTFTFTLHLNARPNGTVTFPIVSNNTAQGDLDKSEVVFNSSNWNIPQEVTIIGQDDGNTNIVNYTITAGPSTADPAIDQPFTLNNNALVLHARNTSPGFDLSPASKNTGEWGSRANFTFRLTSPPTANVTCYYYIDDETEGRSITGSIDNSFPIDNVVRRFTRSTTNWGSNTTIWVEGVDDEIIDGNQPFHVVFLPCSSADPDYDGLIPPSVQFINEDND